MGNFLGDIFFFLALAGHADLPTFYCCEQETGVVYCPRDLLPAVTTLTLLTNLPINNLL